MAKIKKVKLPNESTARDIVDAGAVRFDEAQSLTATQKTQARSNIGVSPDEKTIVLNSNGKLETTTGGWIEKDTPEVIFTGTFTEDDPTYFLMNDIDFTPISGGNGSYEVILNGTINYDDDTSKVITFTNTNITLTTTGGIEEYSADLGNGITLYVYGPNGAYPNEVGVELSSADLTSVELECSYAPDIIHSISNKFIDIDQKTIILNSNGKLATQLGGGIGTGAATLFDGEFTSINDTTKSINLTTFKPLNFGATSYTATLNGDVEYNNGSSVVTKSFNDAAITLNIDGADGYTSSAAIEGNIYLTVYGPESSYPNTARIYMNGAASGASIVSFEGSLEAEGKAYIPVNVDYLPVMEGTDGTDYGKGGVVPEQLASDAGKYLRSDGTWKQPIYLQTTEPSDPEDKDVWVNPGETSTDDSDAYLHDDEECTSITFYKTVPLYAELNGTECTDTCVFYAVNSKGPGGNYIDENGYYSARKSQMYAYADLDDGLIQGEIDDHYLNEIYLSALTETMASGGFGCSKPGGTYAYGENFTLTIQVVTKEDDGLWYNSLFWPWNDEDLHETILTEWSDDGKIVECTATDDIPSDAEFAAYTTASQTTLTADIIDKFTLETASAPEPTVEVKIYDGAESEWIDLSSGGGSGSTLPSQSGHSGHVLVTNGSAAAWEPSDYVINVTNVSGSKPPYTLEYDKTPSEVLAAYAAGKHMYVKIPMGGDEYACLPITRIDTSTGLAYATGTLQSTSYTTYLDIDEDTSPPSYIGELEVIGLASGTMTAGDGVDINTSTNVVSAKYDDETIILDDNNQLSTAIGGWKEIDSTELFVDTKGDGDVTYVASGSTLSVGWDCGLKISSIFSDDEPTVHVKFTALNKTIDKDLVLSKTSSIPVHWGSQTFNIGSTTGQLTIWEDYVGANQGGIGLTVAAGDITGATMESCALIGDTTIHYADSELINLDQETIITDDNGVIQTAIGGWLSPVGTEILIFTAEHNTPVTGNTYEYAMSGHIEDITEFNSTMDCEIVGTIGDTSIDATYTFTETAAGSKIYAYFDTASGIEWGLDFNGTEGMAALVLPSAVTTHPVLTCKTYLGEAAYHTIDGRYVPIDNNTIGRNDSHELKVKDGGLTVSKFATTAVSTAIPATGAADTKVTTEKAVADAITAIPTMTAASSSAAGAKGFVPAPSAGDEGKYLKGDGTWSAIDLVDLGVVADAYDAAKTYAINDVIIYNNKLYRNKTAISTAEAFDVTKWNQISIDEGMYLHDKTITSSNPITHTMSASGTFLSMATYDVDFAFNNDVTTAYTTSSDLIMAIYNAGYTGGNILTATGTVNSDTVTGVSVEIVDGTDYMFSVYTDSSTPELQIANIGSIADTVTGGTTTTTIHPSAPSVDFSSMTTAQISQYVVDNPDQLATMKSVYGITSAPVEDGDFIITAALADPNSFESELTVDKTPDEVAAAFAAGKNIYITLDATGTAFAAHLKARAGYVRSNGWKVLASANNGQDCIYFYLNSNMGDEYETKSVSFVDYTVEVIGASASDDGVAGIVPAPSAGDEGKFLKGDGTWAALDASNITGTIDSTQIADDAVTTDKIADNTITTSQLATSIATSLGKADSALQSHQTITLASGTSNGTLQITTAAGTTDNIAVKGLGSAAYTASSDYEPADNTILRQADIVDALTSDSTTAPLSAAQGKALNTLISSLSTAMVFKGSLGTGGTVTALPTASSSTIGNTYRVITAGTYASQTANVGDMFVCNDAPSWVLIASGEAPSGTVINVATGTGLTGGPITTSGTISLDSSTIASLAKADGAIPDPTSKSDGQFLKYSNADKAWIAADMSSSPTSNVLATATVE